MADHSSTLSSCWTSSSSSFNSLLVVITLTFVSGIFFILDPSNSQSSLSYNPWFRRAGSHSFSSPIAKPKPITNSSLSSSPSLSPSFSSQIVLTPGPASQPNEETQEGQKGLLNKSDVPPPIRKATKVYTNLERLETDLSKARAAIKKAAQNRNQTPDQDYVPQGTAYWNPSAFHRSYLEMEKNFKVFVYEEGELPIFHDGPKKSIYSSEGIFINLMEIDTHVRTRDPEKAQAFFLPFSVSNMVDFVYVVDSHDWGPIDRTVNGYVDVISRKYPFWNRSLAADHFVLNCHAWGPDVTKFVHLMFKNSIRVLCNANTSEGFRPSKDATLPEMNLFWPGSLDNLIDAPSPSHRPILGFFAGGRHGPIRAMLLDHWKNKDNELQVFEYLPKGISYKNKMTRSKFCLCPSGDEIASPRIVEAMYAGCVPVLIKDYYYPPFADVLNWESFSVILTSKDIPNLKKILKNIPWKKHVRMQKRVLQVRKHFVFHNPPQRFDLYNMLLHSVWLRRLNVRVGGAAW